MLTLRREVVTFFYLSDSITQYYYTYSCKSLKLGTANHQFLYKSLNLKFVDLQYTRSPPRAINCIATFDRRVNDNWTVTFRDIPSRAAV